MNKSRKDNLKHSKKIKAEIGPTSSKEGKPWLQQGKEGGSRGQHFSSYIRAKGMKASGDQLEKLRVSPTVKTAGSPPAYLQNFGGMLYFLKPKITLLQHSQVPIEARRS